MTAVNNHHDAYFLWYAVPIPFSKLLVANTIIICTEAILSSFNYSSHAITKLVVKQISGKVPSSIWLY